MDNLRIILLILGVIIVAAIYLWARSQRKNNLYDFHTIPSSEDDDETPMVITTGSKFDGDITSELANLNNIMSESSQTITHDEFDVILSTDT